MTSLQGTQKKGGSTVLYIMAAVAAIGGILFGFDTGVISGALLFIKKQWTLNALSQEMVVSAVLIGAMLGSILSGKAADIVGRRKIIIITGIIFVIGTLVVSFAESVAYLVAGRIIIGIAIGIASFSVPLYISEVSPPHQRGALVSLNQLAITVGILVSYFVDDAFAGVNNGWRLMFLSGIIPALILSISMFFIPRTPRWLVMKGKEDEAKSTLEYITPGVDAESEVVDIKEGLSAEKGGTWKELIVPHLRLPLIIGIGLMLFQQMTGINTVIYYAPTIFEMAGFESGRAAIAATIGVGVLNVAMTVVAIYIIDKVGRKPLLYFGLAGMALALGILGLAFKEAHYLGSALKWVSVGGLLLYIASFAVSLGPIAWLIISEIYPLKIRGLAMSIATFSNWAFNFIVAGTFLTIVHSLGASSAFWIYAVLSVAGWIFCYFCVPETKGHTLEAIEEHWIKHRSPREL